MSKPMGPCAVRGCQGAATGWLTRKLAPRGFPACDAHRDPPAPEAHRAGLSASDKACDEAASRFLATAYACPRCLGPAHVSARCPTGSQSPQPSHVPLNPQVLEALQAMAAGPLVQCVAQARAKAAPTPPPGMAPVDPSRQPHSDDRVLVTPEVFARLQQFERDIAADGPVGTPSPRIPHPPVETSTGAPSHTPGGFSGPVRANGWVLKHCNIDLRDDGRCGREGCGFQATDDMTPTLPHPLAPVGFPGPCCFNNCGAPATHTVHEGNGPTEKHRCCDRHVSSVMAWTWNEPVVTRMTAKPSEAELLAPSPDRWPEVQSAVDAFRELAREAGVSCDMAMDAVLAHFNPFPPRKEREVFCKCQRRMHRLGEGWSCDSGCGGYLTGREADEGKWQGKPVAAMCAVPPPVITAHFAMGVIEQTSNDSGGVSRNIYDRLKAVLARADERKRQRLVELATAGDAAKTLVLPPLCHGEMEKTHRDAYACYCGSIILARVVEEKAAQGLRLVANPAGGVAYDMVPMPRSTP